MSKIYAIGDVQGCAPSLKALVKKLPDKSKMIFLGDLVNRGPDSLGALRHLKRLQEAGVAECILGNHDLHLLALDAGLRQTKSLDTIDPILKAVNTSCRAHQTVSSMLNTFLSGSILNVLKGFPFE